MSEQQNTSPKPERRSLVATLRHNLWIIILAVAVPVFLALLEDVAEGEIMRLDQMAYTVVVQGMRTDWLTPIMQSFSELGQVVVLVMMLFVVAVFAPGRHPGRMAAVNLACVLALNQALKFIIQRPRPEGFRLVSAAGYSFPSGHSMVAMGFYGLLVWMAWHYLGHDNLKRWLAMIGFSLVIVGVGLSRVYLGVHYASDVVAGFCVSLIWLVFYTRIIVPILFRGEHGPGDRGRPGNAVAAGRHLRLVKQRQLAARWRRLAPDCSRTGRNRMIKLAPTDLDDTLIHYGAAHADQRSLDAIRAAIRAGATLRWGT